MNKTHILSIMFGLLLAVGGCSENNDQPGSASLQFFLTDNPGDFQQVNIDLVAIKVIMNDSVIDVPTIPGIYNLLDFTNGKDTLVADAELEGGHLSQVRLILGENNSLMVDDVVHDLKTPSAQTSGLKLNVHQEIIPGEAYSYVIDFDAMKSIVCKGNGGFNLKPVIRVFTEVLTGSVHGIVSPASADSLINLIRTDDTLSTQSDTLGHFMFRGLDPGLYDIEMLAVSGYSDTTLSDIEVFAGETTHIDTVFFE